MYDVAVIGGGISGCMAAIAAARCGASVILIEKYGFLGGTLTACGTGPMMTFHAGDVQVVRGVTNELIERLMNKGFSPGHIFDTTGYTYTVTPFSAEGMKLELEDMMAEAGVELLYHSVVCDVEYENAVINSVEVYGKNGKRCIESRMFVDASGDCDLAFLAGLETNKGREADGKCQPMTMNFKVINVDTDRVKEYIMNNNDEFPRLKSDLSKVTRAPKLSIGGYVNTLKKAQKTGKISFQREDILFFETEDKWINVHTAEDIFQTRQKLYELEELLPRYFLRISKSAILNTHKVYSIHKNIAASSVVEFVDSHKQVFVSRNYYKVLIHQMELNHYQKER